MLLTLMTSLVSGSFDEAAWKNGIARDRDQVRVRPLERDLERQAAGLDTPMLTALLSVMKGPAGEFSVLLVARLMA